MVKSNREQFQTVYWGEDRSTRVRFEESNILPPEELITSCFVFPVYQRQIIISKAPRGWGLPGGHRELNESAEDCARREALEEAAIQLGKLTLVGHWIVRKEFESEYNQSYPPIAYQLLFLAEVTAVLQFIPNHEITERASVTFDELKSLHHNYDSVKDIIKFMSNKYLG
ncbi:MAG TPA: NUDIX domain-containing protein [Candidatus Wunengus sp. YC60]|uniref:NUDIX domain-containing protein n=1 Tax=Candidatus Wunengus sp. YC60 TaxID=3367697 RepID=UPI004025A5E8